MFAVLKQIRELVGEGVARIVCPEDIFLDPCETGTARRVVVDGLPTIEDEARGVSQTVLPREYLDITFFKKKILIVVHTVDRSPTNVATLNFMMFSRRFFFVVVWGILHDIWNSLKTAGKRKVTFSAATVNGKKVTVTIWSSVIKFSSVCNINYGPFRSSVWGKSKQGACKRIEDTKTETDPSFQESAREQASLLGHEEPTTLDEFRPYFRSMVNLKSATEAGFVCKFSRWCSVPECWEYHRPEWFLSRPVLREMSGKSDELLADIQASATAQHDSELAAKLTDNKRGLLQRAPGYVNMEVATHLEIFTCVSKPLTKFHSYRASQVIAGFKEQMKLFEPRVVGACRRRGLRCLLFGAKPEKNARHRLTC